MELNWSSCSNKINLHSDQLCRTLEANVSFFFEKMSLAVSYGSATMGVLSFRCILCLSFNIYIPTAQ